MPFPSAAEVQGVPATPSAQANGGLDIASLIQHISSPFPQGLTQSATTPVQGGHAMQVPSSLQQPIGPHQDRPMDQRQVVGGKAAKLQGIGNAITGATNAIGAVVTKEAQIKQNQIKDSATKVIQAQQAIDEAKQLHDSAIATGDAATASKAQEMIQKNTQARDAIFADPKMRKALVKGFDISYTDPSANKTEEHTAVMAAMKDAKNWQEKRQKMQEYQQQQNQAAGSAAGEAFAKGQPQGMAQNVLAEQKVAALQQQQKMKTENLKAWLPLITEGRKEDFDAWKLQQEYQNNKQQDFQAHQYKMQEESSRMDNEGKLLTRRLAGEGANEHRAAMDSVDKAFALQQLVTNSPDEIIKNEAAANNMQSEALNRLDARRTQLLAQQNKYGIGSDAKKVIQDALDQNTKDRASQQEFGNSQQIYFNSKKRQAGLLPKDDTNGAGKSGTGNGSNVNNNSSKQSKPATNYSGRGVVNMEATKTVDFFNSFLPKSFAIPRPERGELPTWGSQEQSK